MYVDLVLANYSNNNNNNNINTNDSIMSVMILLSISGLVWVIDAVLYCKLMHNIVNADRCNQVLAISVMRSSNVYGYLAM